MAFLFIAGQLAFQFTIIKSMQQKEMLGLIRFSHKLFRNERSVEFVGRWRSIETFFLCLGTHPSLTDEISPPSD
jgi:hypothetical protein